MKKRMLIVLSGMLLMGAIVLGGLIVHATEWFTVGDNGVMTYETIDQACIELYSDVSHERSFENGKWVSVLKPKDIVKSVKSIDGNEVDSSNLKITYQAINQQNGVLSAVSEDDALNENGTLNFDRYKEYHITFDYTYDSSYMSGYSTIESTISKTVVVYEGIN
ncbi:hypothetical protein [Candidatus Enterococcus clewellii]|uniref:Uncharacterized protein n=1 Tax=Candidatus Enterococcus clewellii TaxID=1834193 RepID=A0AAQ3VUF3_9ENTE